MYYRTDSMAFTYLICGVLIGAGCIFSPRTSDDPPPDGYFNTVDTPEKLLANFTLSYEMKNLNTYLQCLHNDFEFILLEVDWDDYNNDGIIDQSWGLDIEESFTSDMFSSSKVEVVELILNGDSNTEWYGDPTGMTRQLYRSFSLKVYYWDGDEQVGYRAQGDALFLCRPDENGEYRIWQWTDLSDV